MLKEVQEEDDNKRYAKLKSVFLYLDLFLSHLGAKIKKNIFTVHESHFFFMK